MMILSSVTDLDAPSPIRRHYENKEHQRLVEALQKDEKTIVDAERIYENIEKLEFFKNLFNSKDVSGSKENYLEFCSSLGYEVHDKGRCVFREGDPTNHKFYVILSGEVAVITNKNFDRWLITEKDRQDEAALLKKQLEEAEAKRAMEEEQQKALELSRLSRIEEERSIIDPAKKKRHRFVKPKSIETKFVEDNSMSQNNSFSFSNGSPNRVSNQQDILSLVEAMSEFSPDVVRAPRRKSGFITAVNVQKFVKNLSVTVKSRQAFSLFQDEENQFSTLAAKYGHISKIQGKGTGFGEIAIGEITKRRTATILCKTKTELLTIDSATYNNFIKKDHDRRTAFILSALATVNIFIETTRGRSLVSYSFEPKALSESDVLTDEGEVPVDPRIFLIESGTFRVERKFMLDIINPLKKEEVVMTQEKWVTLCNITPGAFAGEEILFQNNKTEKYEYRITVTSKKASVLSISKQNFKQTFTHLGGLSKFYHARKVQRDELFEKLKAEGQKHNFIDPHNFLASNSSMTPYMSKNIMGNFQKKKDNQMFSQLIHDPAVSPKGKQQTSKRTHSAGALQTLVEFDPVTGVQRFIKQETVAEEEKKKKWSQKKKKKKPMITKDEMAKRIHKRMIIQPNQEGTLHSHEGEGLMSDVMFHAPIQTGDIRGSEIALKNFATQSVQFEKMMNKQENVAERQSHRESIGLGGISPKKSSQPVLFTFVAQEEDGKSILNLNPTPLVKASRFAALQQHQNSASSFRKRTRDKDKDSDSSDSLIEITASATKSRGDKSTKKFATIESPIIQFSGIRSPEKKLTADTIASGKEDTRFKPVLTVTSEGPRKSLFINDRPRSASYNLVKTADNVQDIDDRPAEPHKRSVPTTRPISSKARVGVADQTIFRNPEVLQKKLDFLDCQVTPRQIDVNEPDKEIHTKLTEIDNRSSKPNISVSKRRAIKRPATAASLTNLKKEEPLLHEFIQRKIQSTRILTEQPYSLKTFITSNEPSSVVLGRKRSSIGSIDSRFAIPSSPLASPLLSVHMGTTVTQNGACSSMGTGMSFKIERPTTALSQKTSISKVSSPRLLEQLFGSKSTQTPFTAIKTQPQTPINISAFNSSPHEILMSNKSLVLHTKGMESLNGSIHTGRIDGKYKILFQKSKQHQQLFKKTHRRNKSDLSIRVSTPKIDFQIASPINRIPRN